jgi:hypothetical protein
MVVAAVGFRAAVQSLNVYLQKKPIELRHHFDVIPSGLGDWKKQHEEKMSTEMVEELGTDLYLDRGYVRETADGEQTLLVHIAYYTGMIDAVPHVPDRCLVAGGFNTQSQPTNLELDVSREHWRDDPLSDLQLVSYTDPIIGSTISVRMPEGDFGLRVTEFSHPERPQSRMYGGYFFLANNRIAVTPEAVKRLAFMKTEEYAYYCKVQFVMSGDRTLTRDDFVRASTDLLEELLPHLMHCLPDWYDVQQRGDAAATTSISSS